MESASHLKPGTGIAAFRVQEKLCEGGMAVLYRVSAIDGGEAEPHVPRLLASGESDFGQCPNAGNVGVSRAGRTT